MPLENFIIYVYCCVADIYPQIADFRLRQRGFGPKLTDHEVITLEIVGEYVEKDQDKGMKVLFQEPLALRQGSPERTEGFTTNGFT